MRILMWHVHGSWMTSFVQGQHDVLVPVVPDRGPDGRGRARTWTWPERAREVAPEQLAAEDVDVVVLQRPHEWELAEAWLGRRLGRDLPVIYLEHNAPQGRINELRHPLADRDDVVLVHVTHFNRLFWDAGATATRVIPHGVIDPGDRYTGELERLAVVINEAGRRRRVTGTDLLPRFAGQAPLDLFGMGADRAAALLEARDLITPYDDLPQAAVHRLLPQRRLYLHPFRWTSLGLALIEAMLLGMPVVVLATTEAAEVVPDEAGVVSNDLERLSTGVEALLRDPEQARAVGATARAAALERFGLDRFLADWDTLLKEVVT